ncbi:P-loop containing nucleoside triphosphate hydrolase protein [Mycena olivaceomarginata]|nr:P-loop containing nucleoside triphosphate hydrolase protein [Mycena olivaceomarginata]
MNTGTSSAAEAPQVVNHCPPPSRIFQGRQTILDALHQFFAQDTQKQKIYVLYGLGGAGKTQIALKFIEESTDFNDCFLVDASTRETIETGLKHIALVKQTGNSSQDALSWLASKQEDWLVFFDNADNPKINLNQFFPKCNHGNIIITSRNPNLCIYGGHSQVSDMEESDAVALLLRSVQQEESAAKKLLALDIVKLCSFIHRDDISEEIFLRAANYMAKVPEQAQYKKRLQQLKSKFMQIFSLRSSSNPEEIQPSKFLSYFADSTGKWSSLQFLKYTNEIKAYPLISFHPESKTFSIHPLVHSWSQTRLADPESYSSCMAEILGISIIEIPEQDRLLASLKLVSHVESIIQVGQYTKAEALNVAELAKRRKTFRNNHLNTLQIMADLATIYKKQGRLGGAEELDLLVLEKRRRLLGNNHPATLEAMFNLAITYDNQSRFEDAKNLAVTVVQGRKELLGDDHLDTIHAMQYLAIIHINLGKFAEAEKLQVVVLKNQRNFLGDSHPRTLDAMHNLAITYNKLGRFEEAKSLQLLVLETWRKLLGDNHQETLASMNNLAVTFDNLGQLKEAEKLKLRALERWRELHVLQRHTTVLDSLKRQRS